MSMFTIAGAPTIEEGDMELIFSDTVTAANQASFSTGTLPTGYASYRLKIRGRTDSVGGVENLLIYFNGDQVSTNYGHRRMTYDSFAIRTDTTGGGNSVIGVCTGGGAPANEFCQSIADIVGPENTTMFKTWSMTANSITNYASTFRKVTLNAGFWQSTAQITSFEIVTTDGGNLVTGSSLHVYGLK